MANVTHGWAFINGLPITGADITLDSEGAAIGATCRVVGDFTVTDEHRNTNEDINESGILVGERHFDSVTKISGLKFHFPTGFADLPRLVKGAIVTIATADDSILNGVWQIDDMSRAYSNAAATEVSVTLRKNAGLTLSAQNPT